MADIIQLRRDTAANWVTANPVLHDGEIGIETDTRKRKCGNGTTAWNSLPYMYSDDVDSEPTANSHKPVESGGTKAAIDTAAEIGLAALDAIAAADNVPTEESTELVRSGGVWEAIRNNGKGAFDISAYKAVGGVLAKFDDLAQALGTNGANVPAAARKPGMSVCFILNSDNKYVQWRLTKKTWSIDIVDWQKDSKVDFSKAIQPVDFVQHGYLNQDDGEFVNSNNWDCTDYILVNAGDIVSYQGYATGSAACICGYKFNQSTGNQYDFVSVLLQAGSYVNECITIPSGVEAIRVCGINSNFQTGLYVSCSVTRKYRFSDNYDNIRGLVQVVGYGTMLGNNSGVTKTGDIYINSNNKKLYICTNFISGTNFTQKDYGIAKEGNAYIMNGSVYIFTGVSNKPFIEAEIIPIDKEGQIRNLPTFHAEMVGEILFDSDYSDVYIVTSFISSSNFECVKLKHANENNLLRYKEFLVYRKSTESKTFTYTAGLNIVGSGSMGAGNSGVTKVGDIYFNSNVNSLYICTQFNSSSDFGQLELGTPYDGAVYVYKGELSYFHNNSFVKFLGNSFYGKKLCVIGDSIPHGQSMPVPSGATQCYQPFPALIAKGLGMSLKNYAIGGSTFAVSPLILGGVEKGFGGTVTEWSETGKDTSKYYVLLTGSPSTTGVGNYGGTTYYHDGSSWVTSNIASRTPITKRIGIMDDDADIVLVFCGTNDFQYNWTPIGTIEDTTPDTFYGAVNFMCDALLAKYSGKVIIFCTPIKRCQTYTTQSDTPAHNGGNYGSITSQNTFGKTLKEYGDIIKEVCATYSIPVVDMYADSCMNPQLASQELLFDVYKTHPTQKGHELMGRILGGKFKSLFGEISY